MIRRTYMSMVMTFLLTLVSVCGVDVLGTQANSDYKEVEISGVLEPFVDVNIVIKKEGKYHYLDTTVTDGEGNYTFETILEVNQVFESIITTATEEIIGTVDTTIEDEDTDSDSGSIGPNPPTGGTSPKKEITFSVDKETIGKGYIISPVKVTIQSGETVWDVFTRVLDDRGIDYDYNMSSTYDSVYVEAIDGDGEFDHGEGSGWMYGVDGSYPDYSASLYKLDGGERVEWRYTTNYGEDLGEDAAGNTDGSNTGNTGSGETEDDTTEEGMAETDAEVPLIPLEEAQVFVKGTDLFTDFETVSDWAKQSVEEAANYGLVKGYEDKQFRPHQSVTRAEFLSILVRAIYGTSFDAQTSTVFTDVKEDAWYKGLIDFAVEEGIASGYGTNFKPNQPITREQMAAMLVNGLALGEMDLEEVSTVQSEIADFDTISDWAKQSVLLAYAEELIKGIDGAFKPAELVTREVASVIALRAYKWVNEINEVNAEMEDLVPTEITEVLDETTAYILDRVKAPQFGVIGGEWAVFGLARRGVEVPEGYYETYYEHIEEVAQLEHSKTSRKWSTKVTETQRLALAVAAIGKDPENVGGINLVDYSFNKGKYMSDLSEDDQVLGGRQGLNELVFGLITMDLNNTPEPSDTAITREMIIETLINDYQTPTGGFSLKAGSEVGEVDVTAMAIQALAPYYQSDKVKKSVDEALEFLSVSPDVLESSESLAQVIVALTTMGIDPAQDTRFVKEDKDLISHLLTYQLEDGGFMHQKGHDVNQMATEQAYYALVAYERLLLGKSSLYQMIEE